MSQEPKLIPHIQMVQGKPMTTSLAVAEHFGKLHKDVLKAISKVECSPEFHGRNFAPMFVEVVIGNGAVRQSPAYRLTRDGFVFLAMGFTGKEAARFKEAYITAFNRMEAQIAAQSRSSSNVQNGMSDMEFMLRLAHMTTVPEAVVMWNFLCSGGMRMPIQVSIANLRQNLQDSNQDVKYSESRVCAATKRLAARDLISIRSTSSGPLTYRVNRGALNDLVTQCKLPWRGKFSLDQMTIAAYLKVSLEPPCLLSPFPRPPEAGNRPSQPILPGRLLLFSSHTH